MIWQDAKYALRSLRLKPGFTAITLLSLAIGIGANAAIFGAVRAVLLRPLPFPDPDALVSVSSASVKRPDAGFESSPSDFADWRRDIRAFSHLAALEADSSALTGDGPAEQVPNAAVTGAFFDALGVVPLYGRTLIEEDEATNGPAVAVLGYTLWERRFGAQPGVVGRTLTIDGQPTRVVGVMPRGFKYPLDAELWLPLRFSDEQLRTQRGALYISVIGRLASGATVGGAQAEMRAYGRRLADLYPRTNADRTVAVAGLRDALVGDVRPALLLLLGAVGFVLLIVCVNVANLFLTRALGRQREWAVRTALGASRPALVRGLLVESAMVGAAGGLGGVVVAAWASGGLAALDSGLAIPLLDQTRLDGTVLAFTAGVSLLASLMVGTLPALQAAARLDVATKIREEGSSATGDRRRRRLRAALIVAETAMAVVLLVGAGLLMRSFVRITSVDLGFSAERVQAFNLSLPEARYATAAARASLVERLLGGLSARPDVEAAGAIFGLPLTDFGYVISMSTLDGRPLTEPVEQTRRSVQVRVVSPGYFRAMGIPVKRGRAIADTDRQGADPAVMVSEAAATLLWPGEDPLGRQFTLGTRLGQGAEAPRAGGTVVGLAGDVRDHGPASPVRPTVYLSHQQFPIGFVSIVIKARGEPSALVEPARALLSDLDAGLPMFQVRTLEQLAGNAVAQPRFYFALVGLFAGAAILLAAIGIYGVLSHSVSQQTREIGIRLALGAPRGQVMRSVVGQATSMAAIGLATGLAVAAGAGRLISGLLFEVQPLDPVTYGAVATGLAAVAILASVVPARRAARVDPVTALRHD